MNSVYLCFKLNFHNFTCKKLGHKDVVSGVQINSDIVFVFSSSCLLGTARCFDSISSRSDFIFFIYCVNFFRQIFPMILDI